MKLEKLQVTYFKNTFIFCFTQVMYNLSNIIIVHVYCFVTFKFKHFVIVKLRSFEYMYPMFKDQYRTLYQ